MAALLLSAMGFRLKLIDGDTIEMSNSGRQPLSGINYAGKPKVEALQDILSILGRSDDNLFVNTFIDTHNIDEILHDVNFIMDATDSFISRELINEYAVKTGKPWLYSSSHGSQGELKMIIPQQTACLNCLTGGRRIVPMACHSDSVDPEVPSLISLYSSRFIKDYMDRDIWDGDLYFISLSQRNITKVAVRKDSQCRVCGKHEYKQLESNSIRGRQLY
jgi:Dinucleotide-utilizing enzymes involved in molybdopterin and thiamine biosynthesis family 2